MAGAVLVFSGFDASLEYRQEPETIFWMRILYSFVPAGMLLFALFLLWKYPLTRARVAEVKAQLAERHAQEVSDHR
jgi:Na+/melibiose symporter-like transporter